MAELKKTGLASEGLVADRIEQLKRQFPDPVTESKQALLLIA